MPKLVHRIKQCCIVNLTHELTMQLVHQGHKLVSRQPQAIIYCCTKKLKQKRKMRTFDLPRPHDLDTHWFGCGTAHSSGPNNRREIFRYIFRQVLTATNFLTSNSKKTMHTQTNKLTWSPLCICSFWKMLKEKPQIQLIC